MRGGERGGGATLDDGGSGVVAALFEEGGGTGKTLAVQRNQAFVRGMKLGAEANAPEWKDKDVATATHVAPG